MNVIGNQCAAQTNFHKLHCRSEHYSPRPFNGDAGAHCAPLRDNRCRCITQSIHTNETIALILHSQLLYKKEVRKTFGLLFITPKSTNHSALIRRGDQTRVAVQPAGLDIRLTWNVLGTACLQLLVGNVDVYLAVRDVDGDDIAFLHQTDLAAGSSLRRNVADGCAAGRTGETAVGDERNRGIQLHAGQRRGRVEHLAHARTALRAFVTDDQSHARLQRVVEDDLDGLLLGFDDQRRSAERPDLLRHALFVSGASSRTRRTTYLFR